MRKCSKILNELDCWLGGEVLDEFLEVIKERGLEFNEKRGALLHQVQYSMDCIKVKDETAKLLQNNILCDIHEGNCPISPRYILPDYVKFLKNGSEYLGLHAPEDMYQAVNALMIIYKYVPSVTGYPVYLGALDEILSPYESTVDTKTLNSLIKMLLTYVSRVFPNGFVHANIGPNETNIGEVILKLELELKNTVPNLSLKVSKDTPDRFLMIGIKTALDIGKPYFVNHEQLQEQLGDNYGIASCFNSLKIGGGSHTLVRLNLKKIAEISASKQDFFSNKLPNAVFHLVELINARSKFIVEESKFFKNSFLADEGLIDLAKFTSMAGVFGLFECVEKLTGGKKMGETIESDELSVEIIKKAYELLKSYKGEYCEGYQDKIAFHAQSGIDTDIDTSAGVRFKSGCEPALIDQIKLQGRLHEFFDAGVSDIYVLEETAKKNLTAVSNIIKGAFENGIKVMAVNTSNSEFIRITGYLVKKSDVKAYKNNQKIRESTVKLGVDSIQNSEILERKVRNIYEGTNS